MHTTLVQKGFVTEEDRDRYYQEMKGVIPDLICYDLRALDNLLGMGKHYWVLGGFWGGEITREAYRARPTFRVPMRNLGRQGG